MARATRSARFILRSSGNHGPQSTPVRVPGLECMCKRKSDRYTLNQRGPHPISSEGLTPLTNRGLVGSLQRSPSIMSAPMDLPPIWGNQQPPTITADQAGQWLYRHYTQVFDGNADMARQMVLRMRPTLERLEREVRNMQGGSTSAAGQALRTLGELGLDDAHINDFFRIQRVPVSTLNAIGLNPEEVNPHLVIESLIPAITGTNEPRAAQALHEALRIARDRFGLNGPQLLYGWLKDNVSSDWVLTENHIDPEVVRNFGAPPDLHPDVAALVTAARAMMDRFAATDGNSPDAESLTTAARDFANFTSGGSATAPTPNAAPPEGGTTVANLAPRRV